MLNYAHCELCPRRCGVDRTAGQLGFCRMPDELFAAKAMLHYWEEPVISAAYGAGTVFFSGCTLGCLYCQNDEISHQNFGKLLSPAALRETFERLIDDGAQNIELVTPTHFLPSILPALTPKLPVPVVYNCGGYERVETLRELEGLVDVYLPDMKYSDPALAKTLSAAPDYPEVAAAAIEEMYRQVGPAQIEDDVMQRGMIVRHLILPENTRNSIAVLDTLAAEFPQYPVSLMAQYTPCGRASEFRELNRRITRREYEKVQAHLFALGLDGFVQARSASGTQYIPAFDLEGVYSNEKTSIDQQRMGNHEKIHQ